MERTTSQCGTYDNVDSVDELILSQKGAPKSHRTTRQIS